MMQPHGRFLIPSNYFAVRSLRQMAEIADTVTEGRKR
ncbi:MAG: glycoside hydrolase family 125 protein [Marinilabiliales bacterium]|nr:glycoside hydrolase family 125 protein [Marinilabiliales bacterium]